MKKDYNYLKEIWNRSKVPVFVRRNGRREKVRLRLPFASDNRFWLKNQRTTSPVWVPAGKYWEVPKSWFNDLVNRGLERYGSLYVIQPYRVQEKCAPACLNATGHECECSCMGANHGAGNDGSWFEVSETFATRFGGREVACRLIKKTT
ncbi:MAG: hypothetical protein U5L06_06355 [Rhodovibrio sp.]|nr:hypothetical protein [Rhodovibrio sp.]